MRAVARASTSARSAPRAPALDLGHVEVSRLARVAASAILVGACALLWAWSRIDLRETALALDSVRTQLDVSRAEQARLRLELESLRAPVHVRVSAEHIELHASASVVAVPPLGEAHAP